MLGFIIKILQSDEWHGVSKRVEIAKGERRVLDTWPKIKKQAKRIINGNAKLPG